MDVKDAIRIRRAYRSLVPFEVSNKIIKELAEAIQLAPSCMNNQPWRYIFIYGKDALGKVHQALTEGNKWAKSSSLIIVVYSKKDLDCKIKERNYNLFDTGLATAFLILRATELGLVAHPMAGYDEFKAKKVLEIPDEMQLITIIGVGKHSKEINPELSSYQKKYELIRPERKNLEEFISIDNFNQKFKNE